MKTEIVRKSIHFTIGIVPFLAAVNVQATMMLLGFGIAVYVLSELLRLQGREVVVISRITALAARNRDRGGFVMGPVTLGLGALLALTFYPNPAASIAVWALAFGDGLASLVGKAIGRIKLPHTGGKSLEGSLACFAAIFACAQLGGAHPAQAFAIALVGTIVELIPVKDIDNILLPAIVGYVATLLVR